METIKLAYITPTKSLSTVASKGDFYLALAHLIDDDGKNEYTRFHKRRSNEGYKVICDNGLFEGAQVDVRTLLHRAGLVGAHTVCAPDVLYNSQSTIKAFKEFIRAKQDQGLVFDVMGIPQANNPADWWECFRFMEMSNDCNLIGLSILSVPEAFNDFLGITGITGARRYIIEQLYHYELLLGRRLTKCHLLGLGEDLSDLVLATRILPNTIASCDSSSCYVHGSNSVFFSSLGGIPGGKIEEKLNFDEEAPTLGELDKIYYNIQITKKLVDQEWYK